MPEQTLIIPAWCWDAMQAYVSHLAPQEACGLLAGHGQEVTAIFPIVNELASPVRFRMAAREQLRVLEQIDAQGLDLLAIFHSHPSGPSTPSATDIVEAVYPVVNIIWNGAGGVWQARGFWIAAGGFEEVPLRRV